MCGENPEISEINPTKGTYWKEVTITGTGFCDEEGLITFKKSGYEAMDGFIISWADDEIIGSVPWGCKVGINKVKVTTVSENESNSESFKFIKPNPRITGLSAKSGMIGSELVIAGKNFGEEDEKSQVRFNKALADVVSWGDKSIIVNVPGMKLGKKGKFVSVKVKTMYGTSNTKKFNVLPVK
ncbi:MAG: hypothetical protein A3C43_07375 [Candidatus Schekmanbacteria bacterium RIFCSPHIGHO2_02_FULL_38_11]|uniref:IPT/TIG domain-containing protein n=1 Tax=Candidatus Schekmanbacteria bacterium RIFCSPLOWO2_12_FULL_38_15 TaxID=1817883 RepID=A0A1F7SL74_9BACT|nr:MAG: hypothetical protein A3H37_08200 [Candidatus Schekmanbacteria bacterium RIFCSPLOWO2_02_FULL_38_14]OGL48434.1 MAG: hypothetical protein A3C43_07375 [Candidatus Schekmanbacteria bacterium RIFCSPHIGHO2_02_FULL_38_11]OGL54519.1 MAG: hypothetical protein A3G31_10190 [Candidatus Schekmanbacteria bacterium RIFCSPLOWO2_12_FULL_38_15]